MKRRTVLFMRGYFFPEMASSNEMFLELLEYLDKKGVEAVVLCPIPTRGVDNATRKYYLKHKKQKLRKHVFIRRFWLPKEYSNPVLRAGRYFLQNIYQLIYACSHRYDVMFLYSTPPTNGLVGALLRLVKQKPFIYYLNDIFPDSLVQTNMTKKGSIVWKVGRLIEDFSYKYCDRIITLCSNMRKNIEDKGVNSRKVDIVPTWVDPVKIHQVPRSENVLFDEYLIPRDKFIVTYAGNIGESQSVITLIEAAKMFSELDEILFVIIGDGTEKKKCQTSAINCDNIIFIPMQPVSKISEVYSLGNVSTVLSKKHVGNAAMPSKTMNILATGTPIIAAFDKDTELERLIEKNDIGYCVEPEEPEELAVVIQKAVADRALLPCRGEKGRQIFLENYTSNVCLQRIYEILEDVFNS